MSVMFIKARVDVNHPGCSSIDAVVGNVICLTLIGMKLVCFWLFGNIVKFDLNVDNKMLSLTM